MTQARTSTAVDAIADDYLDACIAHDAILATNIGVPGHDHELPAYDPDWYEQRSALRREALRALDAARAVDATDRVTVAALHSQLAAAEELRELGAEESEVNNVSGPLVGIREVFDLNATDTADDWHAIATRMAAVPTSIDGFVASLRHAAANGHIRSRHQQGVGVELCKASAGADGFFATLARTAQTSDGAELPGSLRADLQRNAELAGAAYERLGAFLGTELAPIAPTGHAIGRERYAPFLRSYLGSDVDIDETYAWGQREVARIAESMAQTADRIRPGASVAEAMAALNDDPARQLDSPAALQAWMQGRSDDAVAALADTHFDIPEPIRTLECRIAPSHTGVVYYTAPSEDLTTRPGRMWWSVPAGVTSFTTWKELTTVYHEGVPGHHLQVAQTIYRSDVLNRWRRVGSWVSGHGEGWALYAEQLMADLGFLDDPGELLGMLDGQSLRAARVVLDIGVHCELPAPAEVGGGAWDYDKAWAFLAAHCSADEGTRRFELDRYLGWPGQAPSYAIGQRLWTELRQEMRQREGDAFELAAFHRRALDVGSVGLDVLRGAVLGTFD